MQPLGAKSSTTGTIFDFMGEWLDYINPLIFLRDPGKLTLSHCRWAYGSFSPSTTRSGPC